MYNNNKKRKLKLICSSQLKKKRKLNSNTSLKTDCCYKTITPSKASIIKSNSNSFCVICPPYCRKCAIRATIASNKEYKNETINNKTFKMDNIYNTRECIWCKQSNLGDTLIYCTCCTSCKLCHNCYTKITTANKKLKTSKFKYANYFNHFLLFLQLNEYYSEHMETEIMSDLDIFYKNMQMQFKKNVLSEYDILLETYYITKHYNDLITNKVIDINDSTKLKLTDITSKKFISIVDTTMNNVGHINVIIIDTNDKNGLWIDPNHQHTETLTLQTTQLNKHFNLNSKESIFMGLNHFTHFTWDGDIPTGGMCKEIGYCCGYIILDKLFENPSLSIKQISNIIKTVKQEFNTIMMLHPTDDDDVWDLWNRKHDFIDSINNLIQL